MNSHKSDKQNPRSEPVHIIGSVFVECPKCQNQDLVMVYKGFFQVVPGQQGGKLIDPQSVFICVNEDCKNMFDIGDWHKYYTKEKEEADDETLPADNV